MSDASARNKTLQALPHVRERQSALGDLMRAGLLSSSEVASVLAEARLCETSPEKAVVSRGLVSQEAVLDAQARQAAAMVLRRGVHPPDPNLSETVPLDFCLQNALLPWIKIGETTVVATADIAAFAAALPELERMLGNVMMAVTVESDIHDEIAERHAPELVMRAESQLRAEESCRDINLLHWARGSVAITFFCLSVVALVASPALFMLSLLLLTVVSLFLAQTLKVAAALASFTKPQHAPVYESPARFPTVSILVPLFKERDIVTALVPRLARLTYPKSRLDVTLVLEADDTQTAETLAKSEMPAWMRVTKVPSGSIKTKPRALNYALRFCRGDIIGIYDAEDAPAPDQIDRIVHYLHNAPANVACVQGILDFYNPKANWLARCFAIEYATWFRTILPGLRRLGLPIPLGGTTLFLRREAIDAVKGWDAHNVTEDADLGIRLARNGYVTDVVPTVTREEANNRLWPWIKQRSRWLKGYIKTYIVHMRRPKRLWSELGAWKFFGFQTLFLATILQFTLAPVLWSFWLVLADVHHPLATMIGPGLSQAIILSFIASEAITLAIAFLAIARSPHDRLLPWVPTIALYYPFGVVAMYKAIYEMFVKPFYWDKTAHGHSQPTSEDATIPPANRA